MKIKFTPSARRQFLEGLEYIRQDSPTAARQFRIKAEAVLGRLSEFPDSGRAIPEFPELSRRWQEPAPRQNRLQLGARSISEAVAQNGRSTID